jgi:hypothetical protein
MTLDLVPSAPRAHIQAMTDANERDRQCEACDAQPHEPCRGDHPAKCPPANQELERLDTKIEQLDERTRTAWLRERTPLIKRRNELRRQRLGAAIAEALTELADAWERAAAADGAEPDTYRERAAGRMRLISRPYERFADEYADELPEGDGALYTHAALELLCGPGKHFVLIENFYDLQGDKLVSCDSDYGVWFGSGASGAESCDQLRELAADAAAGLWAPHDDQRPRLDDQGRKRFDYRGATRIYAQDGQQVPLTVYDHLLGEQ